MSRIIRTLLLLVAGVIVLFLLIQLIPVNHTNPPVQTQIKWDSPQTEALFNRACADCHSNQTTWPWYSRVAPVSWLVAHDVEDGRRELNISELNNIRADRLGRVANRMARAVEEGEMPPLVYLPMHPTASLSAEEKQTLINGLRNTFTNPQFTQ